MRGNGKSLFNGHDIPVWADENVLEVDGGDGCSAMQIDLNARNCTLKTVKMVKFMFCRFYLTKKIETLNAWLRPPVV